MLFVDAAHSVRASFLGWVWCRVKLFVRAASGRQRFRGLGALIAVTHELIPVSNHTDVMPETVCEWLHKIAAAGLATLVTLVFHNAADQRCPLVRDLAQPLGIELLFLPSDSSNGNLIQRLWKFVKQQPLHSRHYTNDADLRAAIENCLNQLPTNHKPVLDSLMTVNFQTFENVSLLPA